MAKLTLLDGTVIECTTEELAELLEKVGGLGAANGDNFRKVEGREPRVGDYVKFFEDDLDITAGKYYEIIDVDDDGDFVFLDDDGDNQYAFLDYLGEDFEVFEKVGSEKPLKVGDYVVPLESADDKYEITNTKMKLGKVVGDDVDCGGDIRIEVVAHENDFKVGESYPVTSKHFRKATVEEVAQVKAEQKWAKIGRKPYEFKKRDIVRVIDGGRYGSAFEGFDGIIDEIEDYDEDSATYKIKKPVFVKNPAGTWTPAENLELIVPVERRFDITE